MVEKVVRHHHFVIFISPLILLFLLKRCWYSAGILKSICYTFCGKEQKEFLIVSQGSGEKNSTRTLCCDGHSGYWRRILLCSIPSSSNIGVGVCVWTANAIANCISHQWEHLPKTNFSLKMNRKHKLTKKQVFVNTFREGINNHYCYYLNKLYLNLCYTRDRYCLLFLLPHQQSGQGFDRADFLVLQCFYPSFNTLSGFLLRISWYCIRRENERGFLQNPPNLPPHQ